MEHIELKRTKFKKGNFRPRWDCINVDVASIGRIIPSKAYQHYKVPYWFFTKLTVVELMHFKFFERRSIMEWLA